MSAITEARTELDRLDGTAQPDFKWVRVGWFSATTSRIEITQMGSYQRTYLRVPDDPLPIYEKQLVWSVPEEVPMTEPTRTTVAIPSLVGVLRAAVIVLAFGLMVNVYQFDGDIHPFQIIGMVVAFIALVL